MHAWDAVTGRILYSIEGWKLGVDRVALSADGSRMAALLSQNGADTTIAIWDATSGQRICDLHDDSGWTRCLALSPEGKQLISSNALGGLQIWDVATGTQVATMKGHPDAATCITFSPDSHFVASGGSDQEQPIDMTDLGLGVIIGGTGHAIRIWELATREETMTLRGHKANIQCLSFSSDGKTLISGAEDGVVKVWDLSAQRERMSLLGHSGAVQCVAIHPSGDRIASGSTSETKLWDAATGEEVLSMDDGCACLSFSRDGMRLMMGEYLNNLSVWDATPRNRAK